MNKQKVYIEKSVISYLTANASMYIVDSVYNDPIVEEVRRTREKILKEFDYDMKKYIDYIIEKQNENKDRLITKPFEKEVVSVS